MRYPGWIAGRLDGQEVHIVASGPSLRDYDYSKLDGKNVIAVNHAYKMVKHLWTVAVDRAFVQHEDPRAPYETTLLCRYYSPHPIIDFKYNTEFSLDPQKGVYCRKCSGVAAVTTAIHAGADHIYLYGFDCRFSGGFSHSTEGQFKHRRTKPQDEGIFKKHVRLYAEFPAEKITNMNIHSAITHFEKIDGY